MGSFVLSIKPYGVSSNSLVDYSDSVILFNACDATKGLLVKQTGKGGHGKYIPPKHVIQRMKNRN